MEFYKKLTDLLKSARALQQLDSYKKVDHLEKEQYSKEFKDKLLPFLEFKIFSEESRKFRKYWIKYLDKLINSCLQYCSNSEHSNIIYLLDQINKEKEIKNSFQNINNIKKNEIRDKNIENKNQNGIGNISINEKNKNNFNNIRSNKNERVDENSKLKTNMNKEAKLNINEIIEYNHKENMKNNNKSNYKVYSEDVKNSFKENTNNFDISGDKYKKEINNKKNIDKKENQKDNMFYYKKNDEMKDMNNNILKKKSKEEIELKKEKSFDINKKIYLQFQEINLILNNNDNINYNNQNFKENKNIQGKDKNIINMQKEEKNPESKNKKQNINKTNPSKKEKEMEELCDKLLDNNNKNNIIQIIFNSLLDKNKADNINDINDINKIISTIFSFVKNNKKKNLNIDQLKEKLITLICILYPFSKGNKPIINEDVNIFLQGASSEIELYEFLNKSIIIKPPAYLNFKFVDFNENKIPNSINIFCDDLKINSTSGKYEIYNAFTFLVILRNLRKYDIKKQYKKYFKILLKRIFDFL